MEHKATFGKILLFFIISYLGIGLVYSLSGYIQLAIDDKSVTFSPLIGIPLDLLGWPLNMRADYIHGFQDLQFFITFATILIAFILFLRFLFRKPKELA